MELPVRRRDAQACGLTHYFTGNPCARGHVEHRFTANGECASCPLWRKKRTPRVESVKEREGRPEVQERKRAAKRKWNKSEKGRAAIREGKVKYFASDHGKEAVRKYGRSESRRVVENVYRKRKYASDLQYRVKAILRARLTAAVKGAVRNGHAIRDLGCTVPEFLAYCEAHPNWRPEWTWADFGTSFELDHVRALGLFDLLDPLQRRVAAHHTNIQPLGCLSIGSRPSGISPPSVAYGRLEYLYRNTFLFVRG